MKPSLSFLRSPLSLSRVIQASAAFVFIVAGSTVQATDYIKANNESNLNTNGSWLDSAGNPATSNSPNGTGSTDLWTWDNRVTNAASGGDGVNNVRASDQGVKTIRILDPEVAVAISLDTATAGRTMTYTAGGGIDMANATQDLTFVSGFYRATGGVAASFNVKTGRKLEFLSAASQNVRNNSSGGTVSMNTDGVSAGRIVIGGVFNPSNVIIGAGVVEFNSSSGTSRNGTSSTVVNGGKLVVNNTSGSATGSGAVNINSTATLTGQGIMSGLVTVASGATLIPGLNGVGSLTAGSLTLAAGSTTEWEGVDPLNSDLLAVTGSNGLTINGGTLKLYNVGTTAPFSGTGTYKIFSFSGIAPNTSNLSVAESSKIDGQSYLFGITIGTPSYVTLQIGADTRPKASWNVDADGIWSTGTNWTGGVSPNASTSVASLGGALGTPITAPRTVTLNAPSTVGTLNIDSAQSFTLAGSSVLTFDVGGGPGSLNVQSGSHTISAPLYIPSAGLQNNIQNAASTLTLAGAISGDESIPEVFPGIAKSGPGTLIITGDNSYTGITSNSAGILQIGAGGTSGSVAGKIVNSGTLRFNRSNDLTLDHEISGTGNVDFAGSANTSLTVANTYSGTTTISAGTVIIGTPASLQNSTLNYTSAGGTLVLSEYLGAVTLGGLSGDKPFPLNDPLANPISLNVGGNNASTSYSGSSIGTGTNFTKTGTGTFAINGTHAFTGNTTIGGGVLSLDSGADLTTASVNPTAATAKLRLNGGTLHASGSALIDNASAGFEILSGTATFNGSISNPPNITSGNCFINVTGGTLNAASLSLSRNGTTPITAEPAGGLTNTGLYINGGTVGFTGTMLIGNNANSNVNARMDSGSLTVGGAVTVAINSPDRWSVLDIAGGAFTSTDVTTGVRLGGASAGNVIMHVHGSGTVAKAERFQFGQPDFGGKAILSLGGGNLYVGAGGMILSSNTIAAQLRLAGGILGATADSTSTVPVSLTGAAVVTGADATDTPHTVTFSGNVTGSGSLIKNGSGSVSFTSSANSFTGTVSVLAGTLGLGGGSGAITVDSGATLVARGTLSPQASSSINGTLAVRYDVDNSLLPGRVQSLGTLALGGGSALNISGTGTLTAPVYILASGASGISGSFGTVSGVPSGYTLNTSYNNGSGFPVIALVSNSASPYDLWAGNYSLSGPSAATSADADNDGVLNLIEFALGSNPTQSSPGPVVGRSGDFLTLTFPHIAGGNLTYIVEAGDDLANWATVATYPAFGSAGTTTYTDNVAVGSTTRRMLRLRVVIAN